LIAWDGFEGRMENELLGELKLIRSMRSTRQRSPEVTVIIPTLNERENAPFIVAWLETTFSHIEWEVIFVDDDSSDGTADVVREIAQRKPQVRCLQRIARRGRSSACIEGALASAAPFVAIVDADLQRDETLSPRMLAILAVEPLDIVVGSRYVEGGDFGGWSSSRQRISSRAGWLSRLIISRHIKDPMSGLFMMPREIVERTVRQLSGQGFKILLSLRLGTYASAL
jgi:dolichol-phosphate mannosyltransferase